MSPSVSVACIDVTGRTPSSFCLFLLHFCIYLTQVNSMSVFLLLPLLTSFLHLPYTGQQHERVSPFCFFSPHSCILLTQVDSMSAFLLLPHLTSFLHLPHTGQQHERVSLFASSHLIPAFYSHR